MKVLVTGASGAMARLVIDRLLRVGHTVLGIDGRPWPDPPEGVTFFQTDLRKRPAEGVFRRERPKAVIHMATVTYFDARREERYRINLNGTRAILDRCEAYGVEQVVFIGRHTIYGAAPDAPLYRTETEPPLAVATFPTLADLVAADLFAQSALWRVPKMRTAVLRLVYTLGPSRRGTLASFLAGRRVPMIMGFDPLFQFMHEHDAATAIVAALTHQLNGVFNIAGPQPVPLSLLSRAIGKPVIPMPETIFQTLIGRVGFPKLPRAAMSHLKYPVVVDGQRFVKATGWSHRFDEVQVMDGYRWS